MFDPHMTAVAIRKANQPEGWEPFEARTLGDEYVVTGSMAHVITKGDRKGQKRWSGRPKQVFVSKSEISQECLRYESETGNCYKCLGKGKVVISWSSCTGHTYDRCNRCNGKGAKM
jgi:hypothetical protein